MQSDNLDTQNHYQLDNIDRGILRGLLKDARTPYTEIARDLVVSPGTIHVRMKKMEAAGLVSGNVIQLDAAQLGFDLEAFIGVYLEKGSIYKVVIEELRKIEEITEAYYTTGQYGIFLKIACRNTKHLRAVLNEKIQAIEGIHRTETFISLEEGIKRSVPV